MKVETKCKFCQREIEMEVDEAGFNNPAINAAAWLKNLACNRCAGYYIAKHKTVNKIARDCDTLIHGRGNDKIATVVRGKLIEHTRQLCKLICDFKVAQETWDISFVEMLMEKPDRFSAIINSYTANLNRIIRHAQTTT